jgi:16S rRNA (uracil1498-N3)-methyltransferase
VSRRLRVYVAELAAGSRSLPRAAVLYLTQVHRLGAGDVFSAFDPEAELEADGVLVRVGAGRATCELGAPRRAPRRGALGASLLCAIGKSDKAGEVVRAATALGASAVTLLETERSLRRSGSSSRLRSIAIDAARQCGRGDLPKLAGPVPLEDELALWRERSLLKLCLDPRAERPLAERVRDVVPGTAVALLVGPEGGLTPAEVALAAAAGFEEAALGPHTLRSELACAAALGCLAAFHAGERAENGT